MASKNEDGLKNEDDHKNEDYPHNGDIKHCFGPCILPENIGDDSPPRQSQHN